MLDLIPQFNDACFMQLRNSENMTVGNITLDVYSQPMIVTYKKGAIMELAMVANTNNQVNVTLPFDYVQKVTTALTEAFYRQQKKDMDLYQRIRFVLGGLTYTFNVQYMELHGKANLEVDSFGKHWECATGSKGRMFFARPDLEPKPMVVVKGDAKIGGDATLYLVPYSKWEGTLQALMLEYQQNVQSHSKDSLADAQ